MYYARMCLHFKSNVRTARTLDLSLELRGLTVAVTSTQRKNNTRP